jgi:hypothetical protein
MSIAFAERPDAAEACSALAPNKSDGKVVDKIRGSGKAKSRCEVRGKWWQFGQLVEDVSKQ